MYLPTASTVACIQPPHCSKGTLPSHTSGQITPLPWDPAALREASSLLRVATESCLVWPCFPHCPVMTVSPFHIRHSAVLRACSSLSRPRSGSISGLSIRCSSLQKAPFFPLPLANSYLLFLTSQPGRAFADPPRPSWTLTLYGCPQAPSPASPPTRPLAPTSHCITNVLYSSMALTWLQDFKIRVHILPLSNPQS